MNIRAATEADLPAIRDIHNDVLLTTTAIWDDVPETLETRQKWFAERQVQRFPVLIAEKDGRIAGFASYGAWRSRCCYQRTVEHTVHIHPGFRQQGVGSALMLELIDIARASNLHVMVGGMSADNQGSICLHRKLGFIECGRVKEVGFKFRQWLDLTLMQKLLD